MTSWASSGISRRDLEFVVVELRGVLEPVLFQCGGLVVARVRVAAQGLIEVNWGLPTARTAAVAAAR